MILEIENVTQSFPHPNGRDTVEVLRGLQLQVKQGETVAILGQSGSGKSTLLSLLAGLDQATSGSLRVRGHDLSTMSEEDLTRFRAENIGIIFQQFHLMSHLTAQENVSLPLELFQRPGHEVRARAALKQVRLDHRETHFPYQLSGGECQRVAIARAIVVEPAILLADEPTGNLDTETGEQVAQLLFDLVAQNQMTLVMVTHNRELAARCQRQVVLQQGQLLEEAA
jgi:putative ABC transport system ATP-binding protein